MEITDRERWDAKYEQVAGQPLAAVDSLVREALEQLESSWGSPVAGKRALDLAAGRGRHALELARRGYGVHAWDVSPRGLAELERHAKQAGLEVATRLVDLVADSPPKVAGGERFDLVCLTWFLHRPLLADLATLVAPGGYAIVATATVDRAGTKPPLRFCLERGELARGLAGFETLWQRESGGRACLLARLGAKSPST